MNFLGNMTVGDVSLSLDQNYAESLLGSNSTKKELKYSIRFLNLLKANAPETKPKLWLCINLACTAAASYLVTRLYVTSIYHEGFPSPIFVIYTILVAVIWCLEAFMSLLVVMKSDTYQLYYVYIELSVAMYYLFAAAYLLINGSMLNKSNKDSAMPDTEMDVVLYGLSCCYNIYCIRNYDSFMSSMAEEESNVNVTSRTTSQSSGLESEGDEKEKTSIKDMTVTQDGVS